MFRLDPLEAHAHAAEADHVPGVRVPEVRQHHVDAVHVQAGEVLDPRRRLGRKP
jgi:hypothetical protein